MQPHMIPALIMAIAASFCLWDAFEKFDARDEDAGLMMLLVALVLLIPAIVKWRKAVTKSELDKQ